MVCIFHEDTPIAKCGVLVYPDVKGAHIGVEVLTCLRRANGTKFGRRKKVADPSYISTARRMKVILTPTPWSARRSS
jgi:hypothetical protein